MGIKFWGGRWRKGYLFGYGVFELGIGLRGLSFGVRVRLGWGSEVGVRFGDIVDEVCL